MAPLFIAYENGKEVVVKYFVELGTYYKWKWWIPIIYCSIACKMRNEAIVKYLIEHGADTNKSD